MDVLGIGDIVINPPSKGPLLSGTGWTRMG